MDRGPDRLAKLGAAHGDLDERVAPVEAAAAADRPGQQHGVVVIGDVRSHARVRQAHGVRDGRARRVVAGLELGVEARDVLLGRHRLPEEGEADDLARAAQVAAEERRRVLHVDALLLGHRLGHRAVPRRLALADQHRARLRLCESRRVARLEGLVPAASAGEHRLRKRGLHARRVQRDLLRGRRLRRLLLDRHRRSRRRRVEQVLGAEPLRGATVQLVVRLVRHRTLGGQLGFAASGVQHELGLRAAALGVVSVRRLVDVVPLEHAIVAAQPLRQLAHLRGRVPTAALVGLVRELARVVLAPLTFGQPEAAPLGLALLEARRRRSCRRGFGIGALLALCAFDDRLALGRAGAVRAAACGGQSAGQCGHSGSGRSGRPGVTHRGRGSVCARRLRLLDDFDASLHDQARIAERASGTHLTLDRAALGSVASGHELDDEGAEPDARERALQVRDVLLDEPVDLLGEVLHRTAVVQVLVAHLLDRAVVFARLIEKA